MGNQVGSDRRLSRRRFVAITGAAIGSAALSGCAEDLDDDPDDEEEEEEAETHTVDVMVEDENGEPLPYARIIAENDETVEGSSEEDGTDELEFDESGTYTFHAVYAEEESEGEDVDVAEEDEVTLTIEGVEAEEDDDEEEDDEEEDDAEEDDADDEEEEEDDE